MVRVKRFLTLAICAAATLQAAPASAHADVARGEVVPCATSHEFNQINYNQTREHVQGLLDGPGRHPTIAINRSIIQREWRLCGRHLDRGRLIVRYSRATDRVRATLWIEPHGPGTLERR